MKNKRIISIALALIILSLTFFTGCVKEEPDDVVFQPQYRYDKIENGWGKITGHTVTIWSKGIDSERIYFQNAFSRYEALTGNKVVTKQIGVEDYQNKVISALKPDSTDSFDVLFTQGGSNIKNFDPDNNFYDLTNEVWVNDVTTQALTQTIYNGKIIGLPHSEASISGTLYNKKIFEKYNIQVPTNCDEFLDVCEKLLQNGVIPMYMPFAHVSMLLYQFGMDSIVQDSDILNGLNNMTLKYSDIPEMKQIVEWYITMTDRGYFGTDYLGNNWDGIAPAMKSEKYAMILGWDTLLYTENCGDPSSFGLMPSFVGVPYFGSFEGPNLLLMTVNKNGKNVDTAMDLLTFMADPSNYNESFKDFRTAPVFKSQKNSISTPQYVENEKQITKLYHDSTAWLRIDGFSQDDAEFILKAVCDRTYSVLDCLNDMDNARINRILLNKN